jgi:hypothetical protein
VETVVELKAEVCPWSTAVGEAEAVGATKAEFTVTETALEAEVTGVEALSVTVQVMECEVPAAV